MHRANAAERAIQTFKTHMKAVLALLYPKFPVRELLHKRQYNQSTEKNWRNVTLAVWTDGYMLFETNT